MANVARGMQEQSKAERERFERELKRILTASSEAGLVLRVIGSLAFQLRCPTYGYLQEAMGRAYTDIDFAAYGSQASRIQDLMASLGYVENREVYMLSGGSRSIFDDHNTGLYVDVFYDRLDFCHVIHWEGRLEVDSLTIPLAELLLEKMQIVEINEKDVIDTIMLLLEHPLRRNDDEAINIARVANLCADDWGLWRTTTENLQKVRLLARDYPQLSSDEKTQVAEKVNKALQHIDDEPKPLAWRLRARVGDRVKWYKEVDEV